MANFKHIQSHDFHEITFQNPRRWLDGFSPRDVRFVFNESLLDLYMKARIWDTFENTLAKPYSVQSWETHPDAGNDDCICGSNYKTLDEALAEFEKLSDNGLCHELLFHGNRLSVTEAIEPNETDTDDAFDDQWRREIAMEAGMLHGTDGYNEVMGY